MRIILTSLIRGNGALFMIPPLRVYQDDKRSNERGNNLEHKKAASNMRRLKHLYIVVFLVAGVGFEPTTFRL